MSGKVETGMRVRYNGSKPWSKDRTVVGVYGGHAFLMVGYNPYNVESCRLDCFWECYREVDGR